MCKLNRIWVSSCTAIMLAASVLMVPTAQAQQQCYADVTNDLSKVGETRLRVYFFRVYDATLFTASGAYPDEQETALQLNYLRDIRAQQLIDTTRDEWNKLGYSVDAVAEAWLAQLGQIWPDVSQGDCLIARHVDQQIRFYNDQGLLGAIDDQNFAERFLAIWLSEQSSFRRNRDELVGAR